MFRKNKKSKNLALLAFATASLLWGINTPLIKLSLDFVPIYLLLTAKFLIGGLFLLFFRHKKWKKISHSMWLRMFIATAIGYVLTLIFIYVGLKRTGGINTSLIYLLVPLMIYFLSVKMLKERFDSKLLLGVMISLLGSILLVGGPLFGHKVVSQGDIIGNLFIFAAVITDALGSTLIKPVLRIVPSKQVTTTRLLMAAAMVLPLGIMDLTHVNSHVLSWSALIGVSYNIVFATVIAYSLYHYGLSKISGEQSSAFYYLDPLAGVVGSVVLLHEQLTPIILLGGLMVMGGVLAGEIKISHHHLLHHR